MHEQDPDDGSRAQDAESHFATLVKFDIVDSTQIQSRLSRPDGLELRRGFRAAVDELLKSHDVRIEWEGDGALIAFGYPEVRVDAAEAAVRTGLRLIDAVRAVRAVPGVRLELRVGIASGPLTIDLRSGAFEGLSINKAERLRTVAAPGGVLIAEDTRRLVRNFFEYEDLGTVQLKDFGPTHAWRVVRETAVVSRFAAARFDQVPRAIVGRADALNRLTHAWSQALAGRGSAICLVGDAGMGKSRLARAVLEQAQHDGAVVLEIDCTPSSGNTPLHPVGVLLRRTARIGASASDAEKREATTLLLTPLLGETEALRALEYLAPLFGMQSAPIPLDKTREQVRTATIAAIVAVVRALAAQGPLALLCEDLHWADDTTAQVVQSVAEAIGDLRVLMVVTRWPKAVTPIDVDAVTATFSVIAVEPLPVGNAAELVRAVAGGGLTPESVDSIVSRCGGVPLLLEEVTRDLMEPTDAGTSTRAVRRSGGSVPPELQIVVESRLGRWPHLKGIIEAASVLGREFPVPVLEAMLPDQTGDVPAALSLFAEHGLFNPPGSGGRERASFRHGLIRDAVYETVVSRDYLKRLHARAADALRDAYAGTPDASPDVLAQHLRMAARLEEAIAIRLAAGEETFTRGAYVEAKGHCDAARALIDEVGDRAKVKAEAYRVCVLLGMVDTGIHGYSADPAEQAYREAQAMFDDETRAELRYPVIRGLATSALVRGNLATAYQYSQDAFELAERSHRPDYQIDAMSVLSYTTLYFGRLDDCRSWIERCLSLYEAEGGENFRYPVPQDAKTAALALLPTAAWLLGDACGAEQAVARGLAHVEHLGRDFDRALMHAWVAGTRYTQRRYLEALHHAGLAYALGNEHKFKEWEGAGAMMALLSQGALQPAPEAIAQAVAAGQVMMASGRTLNASYFLWGIARALIIAGDRAGAQAMLAAGLDAAAASKETRMNPEIWMLQAEISQDRAEVEHLLRQAYQLAESQGAVANALRASAMIIASGAGESGTFDRVRDTLACLNGHAAPDPLRPHWMYEELEYSREKLRELFPAS